MVSADTGEVHVDVEIHDAHGHQRSCHHRGTDTQEGFAPNLVYEKGGWDGADDLDDPNPGGGRLAASLLWKPTDFKTVDA